MEKTKSATNERAALGGLFRCSMGLLGAITALVAPAFPAHAETSWTGQTFLTDYSKLESIPGKEGRDYLYIAPDAERRAKAYTRVMVDSPEVFISAESPYRGAKPEDIAAISGLVRNAVTTALQKRGYGLADEPAADVLYLRIAVTDLKIDKKKRGLMSYTPVGFVVDAGLKAMQEFTQKYDVLDLALQTEVQDSKSGDVLAASVLRRGESGGARKQLSFEVLVTAADVLGDRLACRIDNAHVPAAQRIDCTDPVARESRPKVINP
jgi:hypothetical protein